MPRLLIFCLLAAGACATADEHAQKVDLLMTGGAIYTLEWPPPDAADGRPSPASSWTEAHGWRPSAVALVIDSGRVTWIGSDADAAIWRERAEVAIELAGAAVLPPPRAAGDFIEELRRALTDSAGRARARTVEEAVRAVTSGSIVVGGAGDVIVIEPDPFRTGRDGWANGARVVHRVVDGTVQPSGQRQ